MDSNTLGVAEVCEEANQHVVVDVAAAAGGDFAIDRSDGGVCSAAMGSLRRVRRLLKGIHCKVPAAAD